MSKASAYPVPTVPTPEFEVGTGQHIDNANCTDSPDRPDPKRKGRGKKESSLGGLLTHLRQQKLEISTFKTRRVLTPPSGTLDLDLPLSSEVGTVGTVGTGYKSNELGDELGRDRGSGQSGQGGGLGTAQEPFPMAGPKEAAAENCANRRSFDDLSDERPASHDEMLAGLSAGFRAGGLPDRDKPRALVGEPTDPWHAGVACLQLRPALSGFSPSRWHRLRLDCAALLDQHGNEMRKLGWSTADAFGVHPEKPAEAVHCAGLAVLLNGGKVVCLTETGAVLETSGGRRQTFARLLRQGAVPVWEAQG